MNDCDAAPAFVGAAMLVDGDEAVCDAARSVGIYPSQDNKLNAGKR